MILKLIVLTLVFDYNKYINIKALHENTICKRRLTQSIENESYSYKANTTRGYE